MEIQNRKHFDDRIFNAPQLFSVLLISVCASQCVYAAQQNIVGPPGSGQFGEKVTLLPNGNFVVADPGFDLISPPMSNVGAIYLYDPNGQLISRLTGSHANDYVGQEVKVLANGNFIVSSASWDSNRGAVTWVSGSSGIDGEISSSNSLVGANSREIVELSNGNYVVASPNWSSATTVNAGAVTWCNGDGSTVGEVSAANSLIGGKDYDYVGNGNSSPGSGPVVSGIVALNNGNYVVNSIGWNLSVENYRVGAVTFCMGVAPCTGVVSPTNSLVGSTRADQVGKGGVYALANGNYIVGSYWWDRASAGPEPLYDVGAVTWGNGNTGVSGAVSAANSLVGSSRDDQVGAYYNNDFISMITVLSNGNYIVSSPSWDASNPDGYDAGAVTWGNGATGTKGEVSALNSFVGTGNRDQIGFATDTGGRVVALTELTNGNYVFASPFFGLGAGAVTWGNGTLGSHGVISSANSMVGAAMFTGVGTGAIYSLPNGNYVFTSPQWNSLMPALQRAGAATWGNGSTGSTGLVSAANSLVGGESQYLGRSLNVTSGGNYVVQSNSTVTWGNGIGGTQGTVTLANSLMGSSLDDLAGAVVVALSNGNYVVSSPGWDDSSLVDVGAVTWGNGATGISGTISSSNSLIGSSAGDRVGLDNSYFGPVALSNGNYVVNSPLWDSKSPALTDAGAATWGDGASGVRGVVSSANSLVGSSALDQVGSSRAMPLTNGNYVVRSPLWDDIVGDVGATTLGNGELGTTGPITSTNSLIGSNAGDKVGGWTFPLGESNYVVTNANSEARTNSFSYNGVLRGKVNSQNSLFGDWLFDYDILYDRVRGHAIVGRAAINTVTIIDVEFETLFADGFE